MHIKKRIERIDSRYQRRSPHVFSSLKNEKFIPKNPTMIASTFRTKPYLLKAIIGGKQGKPAVHVVEFKKTLSAKI